MGKIKLVSNELRRNGFVNGLLGIYFFMALIEIVAEYSFSTFFVLITKPFLMPLLLIMYLIKRRKPNLIYITSLLFAWLSGVFLMFTHYQFVLIGTFFSLLFFGAIVYLVYTISRISNVIFFVICCAPFLLGYLFFIVMANEQLENIYYLFVLQSICMIFLGGFASSSYILHPNRSNTYLFISITLFIVSQLVLILKPRVSIHFYQPIQTMLYVFAQYIFYEYVVFEEKRRRYYEIKNAI
jgi:hypothetical protein